MVCSFNLAFRSLRQELTLRHIHAEVSSSEQEREQNTQRVGGTSYLTNTPNPSSNDRHGCE
jgi:hypothetical protein